MKICATMSVPRLGFMDFYGNSMVAFMENNIPIRLLYGVFWGQAIQGGFEYAVNEGYDYVITTDYDSIYGEDTIKELIRLAKDNPEADAICTMQMGRFAGLLASTDDGTIDNKTMMNELVPINTGHFGLTIIKTSALKDIDFPWFSAMPGEGGSWSRTSGKVDDDIYFWNKFREYGKKLYMAARLPIGHLELLIKWPDMQMDATYQTTANYNECGKPPDVWR
jgi:hypothetical protein